MIKINQTFKSSIILIVLFSLLISCSSNDFEKKIPGWYSCSKKIDKTFINADVTYYKNGDLKFDAFISEDVFENLSMKINVKIIGSWKYKDGKIFETLKSIEVNPKIVEEVVTESFYKEYEKEKDKGSVVKDINEYSMVLINEKGEETTYTRIKK
jgi:hypothetical protein